MREENYVYVMQGLCMNIACVDSSRASHGRICCSRRSWWTTSLDADYARPQEEIRHPLSHSKSTAKEKACSSFATSTERRKQSYYHLYKKIECITKWRILLNITTRRTSPSERLAPNWPKMDLFPPSTGAGGGARSAAVDSNNHLYTFGSIYSHTHIYI